MSRIFTKVRVKRYFSLNYIHLPFYSSSRARFFTGAWCAWRYSITKLSASAYCFFPAHSVNASKKQSRAVPPAVSSSFFFLFQCPADPSYFFDPSAFHQIFCIFPYVIFQKIQITFFCTPTQFFRITKPPKRKLQYKFP